jgi:hypothetical protein
MTGRVFDRFTAGGLNKSTSPVTLNTRPLSREATMATLTLRAVMAALAVLSATPAVAETVGFVSEGRVVVVIPSDGRRTAGAKSVLLLTSPGTVILRGHAPRSIIVVPAHTGFFGSTHKFASRPAGTFTTGPIGPFTTGKIGPFTTSSAMRTTRAGSFARR